MERPLSPPQIHGKKFYKTTSEHWQRTSATQKGSPLFLKGDRPKKKKTKRETKQLGTETHPGKGVLGEVSKHQETLSLPGLWGVLESQRAT